MIERPRYVASLRAGLDSAPVVALLGPRQCGKTTLARQIAATAAEVTWLDLEDPRDLARLREPMLALERLTGLVVIDEVQLRPELFPILRVLADRAPAACRFLILGSASPRLVEGASESLAGRVRFVDLAGFDLGEVGAEETRRLWLRGGFPRSFLAPDERGSVAWRNDFIRTFLTRDAALLGIGVPAQQMRRMWTMLAHYHGQTWNASAVGNSLDVSHKTARSYLDLLTGAFMVRQLQPWTENVGKRVRKAPKIYLADTGLLHTLLGIGSLAELEAHPKLGASWEGFALEQVLRQGGWRETEVFGWATHGGAELDLLVFAHGRRFGIEFKYTQSPRTSRSMRVALDDLGLARLFVIHPSAGSWPLDERIEALSLTDLGQLPARMADSPT